MKRIAFTGTRTGMTPEQRTAVIEYLLDAGPFYAIHGDCWGADAEFDSLVRCMPGLLGVVMHPSTHGLRHFCAPNYAKDVVHTPAAPLVRDRAMVAECDVLIAAPKTPTPVLRSGTWATVRYAQEAKKPVFLIIPNGLTAFV